jgi:hypothetical protein
MVSVLIKPHQFIPNNQSPEVLKPGKKAPNLPFAPIAPQFSAILGSRFFSLGLIAADLMSPRGLSRCYGEIDDCIRLAGKIDFLLDCC